jgi:hypothetical protein
VSDQAIWDLWLAHTYQTSIVVADDMGVFAALHESPAAPDELAHRLGFDLRATRGLVRLLAALNLAVSRQGRFQLTDLGREYLLRTSPSYWGHMMRVGLNEQQHARLTAALTARDTASAAGRDGIPVPTGEGQSSDAWAAGRISPARARAMAASMHSHSLVAALGVARHYDFTDVTRILDVGGGSGCFAIAFAQAHPHLRCTVMDLSAVCHVADEYVRKAGVEDRVDTFAADMFRDAWPSGYDAIHFSNVWHDWSVRTCGWLADRAYAALPRGGRIMLHEMLLDESGTGPPAAAAFSMLMLLSTQGQQFTFAEIEGLVRQAGFTDISALQTSVYYSMTTAFRR